MPTPIELQPLGIDVSHHQGKINWPRVGASGRLFAYIKASEGTGFVDKRFKENWAGARAANMYRGAYHFLSHNLPGIAQANHFIDVVGSAPKLGDLPPALDIEHDPSLHGPEPSSITLINSTLAFLERIYKVWGVRCVIYCDNWFWAHYMAGTNLFARDYPLWIAHWNVRVPNIPGGWPYHTFHQYDALYTHVPGVAGVCDVNRFNGSPERLRVLAGYDN